MSKNKKNWMIAVLLILVAAVGFSYTLSDPPMWWVGILAAVIGLALMVLMGWIAVRPGK
ncbi:hypothetical protein [Amycolatopsis mediterranei]|uniref:hypothetical protein n=1 Tax=Amycolatopsis mediterranei TaxID=33910 RepID=UPI001E52FCEB|nr:hypothetical protein [Amycolatopsis mediterranei]UZF69086.1 hypothetical protein ISP_002210 [Amycolatopsis mediterranei]